MELPPNVDFWLKIGAIIIPSTVALVVPILTYLWLSKKFADYQKKLNTEIHEFQTKYSFLHQKRAEIITELYSTLVQIESEIKLMCLIGGLDALSENERKNLLGVFVKQVFSTSQTAALLFAKSQILFGHDTSKAVGDIAQPIYQILTMVWVSGTQALHDPINTAKILKEIEDTYMVTMGTQLQMLQTECRKVLAADLSK